MRTFLTFDSGISVNSPVGAANGAVVICGVVGCSAPLSTSPPMILPSGPEPDID